MLGLAWAGFKNSGPPRGAAFNKLALQLGVSLVTAGIGNLVIYALSRDHLNRFWFDRASGVIVLKPGASAKQPANSSQPAFRAPNRAWGRGYG